MSGTILRRDAADAEPAPHGFSPRTLYLVLALAIMAFTIYGSLIPFNLRMRPLGVAWADFLRHLSSTPRRVPASDFLANILLFVPIGFGLTGGLLHNRKRSIIGPVATVLGTGLAVSAGAEFLQVFARGRISSRYDILAQTIGCAIGITVWFAGGPSLSRWLRDAARSSRTDRLSRILAGYVAAWIFVNLAPFNFTYEVSEIGRRVRNGHVSLVPFGAYDAPDIRMLWDALITMLSAVPLGVFGLVGWRKRTFRHTEGVAFGVGASLVVLMEVAQIFVLARSADSADVFFGCLGVAIGVTLGARLLPRDVPLPGDVAVRMEIRWALVGLAAWSMLLIAYHWQPYDFILDSAAVEQTLGRMSLVPFAGHRSGSAISVFNNLLTTLGLAVPVGLLSAFIIRGRSTARAAALTAGLVLLFTAIEVGQLFLPSRVPDSIDIALGLAGSFAGLLLGRWLRGTTGSLED